MFLETERQRQELLVANRRIEKLNRALKAKVEKRLSAAPAVGEVVAHGSATTPITQPAATPRDSRPNVSQPSELPKELSIDLGNGVKMEFVLIPAGEFVMGSDEGQIDAAMEFCGKFYKDCRRSWYTHETPQRKIFLDSYYIDKFEVDVEHFVDFLNAYGNDCGGNQCH